MATPGHPTGVPNPRAGKPRQSFAPPVRRPPRCYTSAPSHRIAGDPMTESVTGTAPEQTVAWHSLTPTEALERQGVTHAQGLTSAEADSRRAQVRPEQVRRGCQRAALAGLRAPVQGPDADRPAGGRHPQPVHPEPGPDRRRPHRADPAERSDGPQPGGQGVGERGCPSEDDGRQGEGSSRRGAYRSTRWATWCPATS